MEFGKLLKTLEGKVLDTTHIKQLEQAYEHLIQTKTLTENAPGIALTELSSKSVAVFRKIVEMDNAYFYKNTLINIMKQGHILTEAALDELQDKGFIHLHSLSRSYGIKYRLTSNAKSVLLAS